MSYSLRYKRKYFPLTECQSDRETWVANQSGLGFKVGKQDLAANTFADDECMSAPSILNRQHLINISETQSSHVGLTNVPSKTKLLIINLKGKRSSKRISQQPTVIVNGETVPASEEATHLGVVRSSSGSNLPAI